MMIVRKRAPRELVAQKVRDTLQRKKRRKVSQPARPRALDSRYRIQPFIDAANELAGSFKQMLGQLMPSFDEVASGIAKPVAPPQSWSDAEIEAYLDASRQREEELGAERAEERAERLMFSTMLHRLAQLAKATSGGPLILAPVELPPTPGQREQVVFDERSRSHVEPVLPKLAALRVAFLDALQDLDVSRIRECAACGRLFWAARRDKPACSSNCGHVLRSRRSRRAYQPTARDARKKAEQHRRRPQRR
jgi:hypothetical protein